MRILLAEDDFITRKFMSGFLAQYGKCDETVDGLEAVDVFLMALEEGNPYDLVCLDIMMPVMDGYQALVNIRNLEKEHNVAPENAVKVVMTTALSDEENIQKAFELGCTIYSGKPVDKEGFEEALKRTGLEL
uniref:response regulator n=1 Tax=Agathobacter sp. TaxID=2021311 RepID=UPI0040564128